MLKEKEVLALAAQGLKLLRGEVVEAADEGVAVLAGGERHLCELLQTSALPPAVKPGDPVIFSPPESPDKKGIVLGVVTAPGAGKAEKLVLEAGKEIVIQCGEGSITVSADGRIAIKGSHLLSRAKGINKIKGGSVAIN
jgi:hypothetical protein